MMRKLSQVMRQADLQLLANLKTVAYSTRLCVGVFGSDTLFELLHGFFRTQSEFHCLGLLFIMQAVTSAHRLIYLATPTVVVSTH